MLVNSCEAIDVSQLLLYRFKPDVQLQHFMIGLP